jgi:hypothetical protein
MIRCMQNLVMMVSNPLLIVRELDEALFELMKFNTLSGLLAVFANSAYSAALARYCSEVNITSLSLGDANISSVPCAYCAKLLTSGGEK